MLISYTSQNKVCCSYSQSLSSWGGSWPSSSFVFALSRIHSLTCSLSRTRGIRLWTYIILCGILLTLFILWTLFYQRVQYRREASHKKQAQESLRKEKEFLSLALESGDIFAFRYSNGVFEFDHDFYKSLDMPIKPITSTQFQESISARKYCWFIC